MAAVASSAPARSSKTESYVDNKRKDDIRMSNIKSARSVADAVRTSLGPKGMDKMISTASGDVIITNDGATILNKMEVLQPAAKMLVELSKSQDVVAGDGTTTVVVIAGALLKQCQTLLHSGIHPTVISDSLHKASVKAVDVLTAMAVPVELTDRDSLVKSASTSLNSKVVSQYSSLLAPLAVDSVLAVVDPVKPDLVDLRDVKIVKKLGGTVDDTELVKGLVFDKKVSHAAGGPTRVENAKIAVIQFQISPPKTDIEQSIVVSDYTQMDRILKEERNYILSMIKKIKSTGCNVLLIQKSILRDAVTDLSLHYLAKAKILVIKDVERDDIEFITKTLNCLPIANIEHFRAEKLGFADLVEEVSCGDGKIVKITGIKDMGRTTNVLVRGSNQLVLDEAERSLHDALCVVRCLVNKKFLIAGGGAPEIELSRQLGAWSKVLHGMESYCVKSFAEALEVVPYTLAENAGLNPITIVTELRNRHAQGEINAGINVRKGQITNILEENVVQPLLVSTSAITLATECVRTTLHSNNIPKCREPTFFPTRCILSTTAPPVSSTETTVLNLEKLKLSSLEVHSNSGAADRQWSSSSSSSSSAGVLDIENFKLPSLESHTNSTSGSRPWAYSGAVGQGTSLPSEFVTTEYADAAAEAIALARAAVKVAKSAAAMMMNHQTPKPLITKSVPTVPETDNSINDLGSLPSEEDEPTVEELQLLEEQLSASIAVRSKRQVERKERRIRAAEKAEAGIVSVKSAGRRVAASTVTVKPGLSRRRGEKKDVLAFLGGMTNAKLLTAAEEVELSKGIQDLLKLQEVHKELTTRFGVEPTFAEWAAAAHIDQIQLGRRLHYGEECRDKMIRSNIRLVISVARGYYGTKVHLQDIVQEGIRGLVKSAEKFDASKGFKFSTYAHWWIRQAVQRSRAEQSRIIHVPYYMVEVQAKVNEAKYRLDKKLGRKPTRAEIAVETGLSIKRIQSAEDAPRPARSLDIPVGIDNNTKLTDILDDPDQETPEEILIKQTMSEDLEKVLCTLGEKEQLVIRWRFGLEDGKSRTLQEIGDVMGVSRERVRQIELCAFRKLRNTDRTESLRQYLPQ